MALQKLTGVHVSVTTEDGKRHTIAQSGCIGSLLPNSKATLETRIESGQDLYGFTMSKDKILSRCPNLDKGPVRRYAITMQIRKGGGNKPYTLHPENTLSLLDLRTPGRVRIWEVGLIEYDGNIYQSTQLTHNLASYRNADGKVSLPPVYGWSKLHNWLNELLSADDIANFPPDSEHVPEGEADVNSLGNRQGVVKWYFATRKMGVLATLKGDALVRAAELQSRQGNVLPMLEKGTTIAFDELEDLEGGSFKREAKGVWVD